MKPYRIAALVALACIAYAMTGCAQTTFYREGKPLARFGGDMTAMKFKAGPDGSFEWSGDVDHSTPTKSYGIASKGRIVAAAGVATYGISKIK